MGDGPPSLSELSKGQMAHYNKPPEVPTINPYAIGLDSLNAQAGLMAPALGYQAQYAPQSTSMSMDLLNQNLFGQSKFNANAALAGMSAEQRSGIEAEAARTGRTSTQWITDHVSEQSAAGDGYAQALKSQYGYQTPGAVDYYNKAVSSIQSGLSDANTAYRAANVNDLSNLGPQAVAAYRAANPELASAMGNLSNSINAGSPSINVSAANTALANAMAANGGPLLGQMEADASSNLGKVSGIQNTLNQQAQSLLNTNGALSADEINRITQQTRAAAAARGIYDGNSALAAEAMNTESAQRQRLLENQQVALGIDAAGQNQLNTGRSYAAAVQGQGQNLSQFNAEQANQAELANAAAKNSMSQFNAGLSYQQQLANAGLSQQNIANQMSLAGMLQGQGDTALQSIGGTSNAAGTTSELFSGAQGQVNSTRNMFNPFDPTIMNMVAGNQANKLAAVMGTNANTSASNSAGLTAGAGLLAAFFCWVAREVYGTEDGRWIIFRSWLLNEAPAWFRILYGKHGPAFARYISDKPILKAIVRSLMDLVVNRYPVAFVQPA